MKKKNQSETLIEIHSEVFNDAFLSFLDCMARTQIYFGGSGSGKSVFLAQRCVKNLLEGNRNYLICRAVGRTIRKSVFNEILKIIAGWNLSNLFKVNLSEEVITCMNGYQAIFTGLDDVQKVKSITPRQGAITDVWVEEATETDYKTITQLYKRQRGGNAEFPKRLVLSFNPIFKTHWIYEKFFAKIGWADDQKVFDSPALFILKTTYKDNKFLTDSDREDLEAETDSYFYNVYTLGNWGVIGNVIFKNWRVADLSDMQSQFTNMKVGLDFGYSSDPATVCVSHYDRTRKVIYFFDEIYQTGLTNDQLAAEIISLVGKAPIVCDSAEPKSIAELKKYGVHARGAKKGRDSVHHGIQWLQQQTFVVDKKCINLQNELSQYKWKEDANGNPLPIPVERNDHLIDAMRYAYEDEMSERRYLRARSWKGS